MAREMQASLRRISKYIHNLQKHERKPFMKTRIIVDSTADLVAEYKKRVTVVPLTVRFGDEEYIDGVTIDHKTFYEKLVESDALLLKYIDDSKHIWDQGLDAVRYTTIGSVIGTHAGPGAVAVAFFKN